jgi:hypothetical protein
MRGESMAVLLIDAMASAMEPPTFTADPVVDNTLDQAIMLRDWVGRYRVCCVVGM